MFSLKNLSWFISNFNIFYNRKIRTDLALGKFHTGSQKHGEKKRLNWILEIEECRLRSFEQDCVLYTGPITFVYLYSRLSFLLSLCLDFLYLSLKPAFFVTSYVFNVVLNTVMLFHVKWPKVIHSYSYCRYRYSRDTTI